MGDNKTCIEIAQLTTSHKVFWQNGEPYLKLGKRIYACHQGKDNNISQKKKYSEQRELKACRDHNFTKRYKQAQVTKKLGCPVTITVTRVVKISEYKLVGSGSTKYRTIEMSKLIREKIAQSELTGEECFFFNLPKQDDHRFHLLGINAAATEPVDVRVREHITDLVRRGERNSVVVSKLLNVFVENELQENDRSKRRFFPDLKTVRTIVSRAKTNLKASSIDQENVQVLVNKLDNENNNVFFRPCTVANVSENNNNTSIDDLQEESNLRNDLGHHLLFVYQSASMKSLYNKYGKGTILLDATYRTCKYALPLYFVVVETNVNFQVVGVIITQFETKEAISEGLAIFKNWNPEIKPKYGMVDFAAEEITSLESVYPQIKVFICSFHREQAWNRWISKGNNSLVPRKETLKLLRNIANAPTEHLVLCAVKCLQSSAIYKDKLKTYFEGTWLREIKRWALAYKPEDMHINTNNGVERLNKELKYSHLENYKGCSLSEIINVLVSEFLPERYKRYVTENLAISPLCRKYDANLPKYLHGRPKWLIDHIMTRMSLVPELNLSDIEIIHPYEFLVPSSCSETKYSVVFDLNLNISKCECADFKKRRLVCKHILAVGVKYPDWDLNNTFKWLFSDPIFRFDEDLIIGQDEQENVESDKPLENSFVSEDMKPENYSEYGDLKPRGSGRKRLLNKCKSSFRSIESMMYNLEDSKLEQLSKVLEKVFSDFSSEVSVDSSTGLPIEPTSSALEVSVKEYGKIPLRPKKGRKGRVGATADMLKASIIETIDQVLFEPGPVTVVEIRQPGPHKEDVIHQQVEEESYSVDCDVKDNSVIQIETSLSENHIRPILKRQREFEPPPTIVISNVIKKGSRLSDNTINFAQNIIKVQEKQLIGFQNCLLGQNLSFSIQRSGVQIIFDCERQHWVTLEILDETYVNLFDSLGMYPSKSVQKQIAALLNNERSNRILVKIKPVQKQGVHSNNCGVFAIAFALCLSRCIDPSNLDFDETAMRKHLAVCLETGFFVDFPKTNLRQNHVSAMESHIEIFCVCKQPYFKGEDKIDKGLRMAMCQICKKWYHQKCQKIPETIFRKNTAEYTCQACKQSH